LGNYQGLDIGSGVRYQAVMAKAHVPFSVGNEGLFWIAFAAIVAVGAVAMPHNTVGILFEILLWMAAIALVLMAFFWDHLRWHFPFADRRLTIQIIRGMELRTNYAAEGGNHRQWGDNALDTLDTIWGKSSLRWRQFEELHSSSFPDPLIKLDWQIECLKSVSATWFGPKPWER
jgi:hypothetical protein